ncbi:MAG: hypothetical protein JXL67_00865 [Calditrichaeota bacterium]|nr:hypothetical protein [Calditrichota bacterium]
MSIKTKYIFLIFLFLLACRDLSDPLIDENFTVVGKVRSAQNGNLLNDIIIGFKNPAVPDSLLFDSDSLILDIQNSFLDISTSQNGDFRFDFFLAPEFPYSYQSMFAYKKGMKIWHFTPSVDTVYHIRKNRDSLNISLLN